MGIVYMRAEHAQSQVGIWKVEEDVKTLESRLQLNEKELAFYHSLNKGKRNLHWLSSRVLLRHMLKTDSFIEVSENEHGKPYLVNFDYEISITHSYDYAAVIISKHRVGIDIEIMKPVISKIAHKFMSAKELDVVLLDDIKKLYVYWSAKESIYKLNGKKGLLFVEHIYIFPFDYQKKGTIKACICHNNKAENEYYTVHYQEFNGYMFTWLVDA